MTGPKHSESDYEITTLLTLATAVPVHVPAAPGTLQRCRTVAFGLPHLTHTKLPVRLIRTSQQNSPDFQRKQLKSRTKHLLEKNKEHNLPKQKVK